jgi:thioesterase domain-containing protein/acyl carrier protein
LDDDGERVLAGYVVAAAPGIDGPQLREWCAATLPDYMVPRVWLLLDTLPTTPNGKVDRRALPTPGAPSGMAAHEGTAPSTDTERKLAGIWSEILQLPSVGVHANFFDLGGNSLRALRVVLKIREELGLEIPVAALIQSSTVRRLATIVGESDGREPHPLIVPLNSVGCTPLFVFHPLGGHIFGYAPLAGELDGTVTLYGVRALGMEPGESPLDRIAAMVDRYVSDLRRLQPDGPYRLAGWCMGATLAVEVARRLTEEGEDVDFLGLIVADPFDPAPRELLNDQAALVMHAMGGGAHVDYDELVALDDIERQVDHVFSSGRNAAGALRDDVTSPDDAYRLLGVYRASATAIGTHQMAPYEGEAQVFVLAEDDPFPSDMGWSTRVVGPIRRHALPGAPETFLETDHVSRLAEIIGGELLAATHPIRDPDRFDGPRHSQELTHGR